MTLRTSWSNPDGLDVFFGKRLTENHIASTSHPAGGKKTVELYVRGEDIPLAVADAAALAADQRSVVLPAGATIVSSTFLVDELFVGATATLDFGTTSLTGTVADMNGFHAAMAVATLTAGARIAGAGALINTKLAASYRIVFGYNTAAFTAGSGRLVLEYIEPPVQSS